MREEEKSKRRYKKEREKLIVKILKERERRNFNNCVSKNKRKGISKETDLKERCRKEKERRFKDEQIFMGKQK